VPLFRKYYSSVPFHYWTSGSQNEFVLITIAIIHTPRYFHHPQIAVYLKKQEEPGTNYFPGI
jgi:hypothetical protein